MSAAKEDYDTLFKYSFLGEWFDYEAAFEKHFLINYFPSDDTLELFDLDCNRIFLKRTTCLNVNLKDLFVGNSVLIFGRQIKVTDYADCHTKNTIGKYRQHTFILVKPSVMNKLGEILNRIRDAEFYIVNAKMLKLTPTQAIQFYTYRAGASMLPFIIDQVCSGPILALELIGHDAIHRMHEFMGPSDPEEARKTHPQSMRAIYGKDLPVNGFHTSGNYERSLLEIEFWFSANKNKTPHANLQLTNTTCCIIKPHAITDGNLGNIIGDLIQSKFFIHCLQTYYLNKVNVDEYLEIYKDVISDYNALTLSFLNGPCIVMEIGGKTSELEDVHGEFRKFCGPSDSNIARQIRPATLRAKYGVDKYKNAVHCTDLPGDTVLDLEYFFKILG